MLGRLLVAAVFALPAQADVSGLDVKVRSDDAAKPVVVLTNTTQAPCQLVGGSSLGTVAFTRVEQDGKAIEPLAWEVSFGDGMEALLVQRLQTLEPGKSIDVPIPTVKTGPTGTALEMVTWSSVAGTYGLLYPITPGKALTLELAYSVPVSGDAAVPMCPPGTSTGTAIIGDAGSDSPKWILWAGIAGGVLLLILVLLLFMIRGRRRRRAASAAAMLMMATALGMGLSPKPAHATITNIDPSTQAAFDACMATFSLPGNDPAGILPALQAPGVNVTVQRPDTPGDTHEGALDGNTIFIFWDPDDTHAYFGGGGNADPCTALYHELHHGFQHNQGTYSMDPCATPDGRTLPRTEVEATRAQNMLRARLGMPERTHYGDTPLPPGYECNPPPEPETCEGPDCADSNGDPHMLTFDNLRYDFQAVGEFVLTRDPSSTYQVQVRQGPAPGTRLAAVNTAVAMQVGPDKVEFGLDSKALVMRVGGEVKEIGNLTLPGGGKVSGDIGQAAVTWADEGPKVFVRMIGRWGIRIAVQPAKSQTAKLEGLLGNYDGDSANDVRPKGGSPIAEPTFDALYPSYADSWRIDDASSLFTYPTGTNTASYTDKTFPDREVTPESLPGRAIAEALCRRHGVTDPVLLLGCILDVALTGQADFAVALGAGQFFTGGPDFGGIPFDVRLANTGDIATVEFDGTADQLIFVNVPVATVPNNCGTLDLIAPDGTVLKSGCIINGVGQIDSTKLPVTGKYKITVEARNGPGEVRLRVITIKDQVGTLTPDDKPTQVRLDLPGMVGRFTFTGRKDQKVYLDVIRSNMPSQCGILDLRGPNDEPLRSGCIVRGSGELDTALLPLDGTYTITIDPHDRNVGDATIRLINAIDQHGTLTVNGPEFVAKIQQSGAETILTFSGTAGQRIFIDVPSSNLPSQCGILDLRDPTGGVTISGCIVNNKGGLASEDGYVLSSTGTWTLFLDPHGRSTGEAVIKLRG